MRMPFIYISALVLLALTTASPVRALDTPALVLPANGATAQSTSVYFVWHEVPYFYDTYGQPAQFSLYVNYRLQVATDSAFVNTVLQVDNLSDTTYYAFSGFAPYTTYYWRVKAFSFYDSSAWSLTWRFRTQLDAPQLIQPADDAIGVPVTETFRWTSVPGATAYRLSVYGEPEVDTFSYTVDGILDTSYTMPSGILSNSYYYFWDVVAYESGGDGLYPYSNSFTTIAPPPVMISPADGSTAVPLSVSFLWHAATAAIQYQIQIDDDAGFGSPAAQSSQTDTAFAAPPGALSSYTTYYWRVRYQESGGWTEWSDVWSFRTIVQPPSLISPADSATGVPVQPLFQWTVSPSAASYRIQIADSPVFQTPFADVPGLTAAQYQLAASLNEFSEYFWRVAAMDPDGTASWSQTNRFRTIVPPPTLLSPVDGSTGHSMPLLLSWTALPDADAYRIQLSTAPDFSSLFADVQQMESSLLIDGIPPYTEMYWRVSAIENGTQSRWSVVWRFRTLPGAPELLSPMSDKHAVPSNTPLVWRRLNGTLQYHVQVALLNSFSPLFAEFNDVADTTVFPAGFVPGTTYLWRVRAKDGIVFGPWSEIRSFTTKYRGPRLVSPADSSANLSTALELHWRFVQGALGYRLQVAQDSLFSDVHHEKIEYSDTSVTVSPLDYESNYHWRALSFDQDGESEWSDAWTFTTKKAPPETPALISPKNNTVGNPLEPTLEWSSQTQQVKFRLQVSTDPSFASLVVDDTGLTATTLTIGPLSHSVKYYWRVSAKDLQGIEAWSSPWAFTVIVGSPSLLSPENRALVAAAPQTMRWDSAAGADYYQIDIGEDSLFVNPVVSQSGISLTEYTFTGALPYRDYFWRVAASGGGSRSPWTEVWKFTTTLAGPSLVAPANGAANVSLYPVLEWNGVVSAEGYSVQIAYDDAFIQLVFSADTVSWTSMTTPLLLYGTKYYWRVRAQVGPGWSTWSEAWEFTTIDEPVGKPALVSPLNNAAGQSIPVTLRWGRAFNAVSYRVQVASDNQFVNPVFERQGLTDTTAGAGGLAAGTLYYWRAGAVGASGKTTWSDTWRFTTGGLSPHLKTPANGAAFVSAPVTLEWFSMTGAVAYRVQVADNAGFSPVVFDTKTANTTVLPAGLAKGAQYFWRVNADDAGGTTGWSETWTFFTSPAGPALAAPDSGAQQVALPVTLRWLPSPSALSYRIQVAADPGFAALIADESNVTAASYQPSGLALSASYYWRVSASYAGGAGEWSAVWLFSTGMPAPQLSSPPDNAAGLEPVARLVWQTYPGASSYRAQVATDNGFSNPVYDQSGLTGTSTDTQPLSGNTVHYWRIRAETATGPTPWSSVWKFETGLDVPALILPAAGAAGLTPPVSLVWSRVPGASAYDMQVAHDAAFSSIVAQSVGQTDTTASAASLDPSTAYYWRARARFGLYAAPWSPARTFSTEGGVPVLIEPADNAAGVALSPVFRWNAASGAMEYDMQVALDPSFASIVADATGISQTSYSGATLAPLTRHYWRVRGKGISGPGAWSAVWTFTTLPPVPAAPLLTAPDDGATDVPAAALLEWSAVQYAEEYRIQVSKEAGMFPLDVDETVAGTSFQLLPQEPGITYYWRVAASNAAGTGAYSAVWRFTIVAGGSLVASYGEGVAGTPLEVSVQIPPGFVPSGVMLFHKPTGRAEYDSIPMTGSGDLFSAVVPGTNVGIRGIAAWIRARSLSGQSEITDPPVDPEAQPRYIDVRFVSAAAPVPFESRRFAMASIPVALDDNGIAAQFFDDYGEYDPLAWRTHRWNGSGYDEFPAFASVRSSQGFWLITRTGAGFDAGAGKSVNPPEEGFIEIDTGWTQIGSPYAFNIAWDSIPGSSALSRPFGFDGQEYVPNRRILEAWKGYFVLNETGSPVVLAVPPVETLETPSKEAAPSGTADYSLRILASDPGGSWRDSYNFAGIAATGWTVPEPPPVLTGPSVSILHEGAPCMEVVSAKGEDGNQWVIRISHPGNSPVRLSLNERGSLPGGWTVCIVDPERGIRLPDYREIDVQAPAAGRELIVLAGTEAYIAKHTAGIPSGPAAFALMPNYPNPFNPSTIIPYSLAERTNAELSVFDIHGRLVKRLAAGVRNAGAHTAVWDGMDDRGMSVPAGLYYARLTADGIIFTQPMVLTK